MRYTVVLATLILALLGSAGSFSQTSSQPLDTRKIYITSFFDCDVYWNNRRVAILPKGTRAELLLSTKEWILVRYWSRRRYITGWIRRR